MINLKALSNASSTTKRCVGVLMMLPLVAAIWVDAKSASVIVMILAFGLAYEFYNLIKIPSSIKLALSFCVALQSLPIWIFDMHVIWHIGLALFCFLITFFYNHFFEGIFVLILSICICFSAWLIAEPAGHLLFLLLVGVIAACDTAGYFVGRLIGGPRLVSSVSPNKTVSGSFGGIAAATITMMAFAHFLALSPLTALFFGIGLAVLSQIGDLFESALKRRCNVKDSSSILPGHGGLLDRFDGYLLTVPGFYIFFFVFWGGRL